MADRSAGPSHAVQQVGSSSGSSQVEAAKENQWKAALRTGYGTVQFTVMPLGLCGALFTFQRTMQNISVDESDEFVAVYLDDVLMFSNTREDHGRHLEMVPRRTREHRLFVKLSECKFATQDAIFGFCV